MGMVLEIENVTKTYPDGTNALKNVSLTIQKGELVSIIGPSGAGKSTLLRTINKLVPASSGKIIFNSKHDVTQAKGKELREIRRQIGMVFQSFNLIKRSQAVKNVLQGKLGYMSSFKGGFGMYAKEDVQQALLILARVGLEDQAFKRADELSGGQQQRVGIARALNQNPLLLLADEPIASLDPASSANVMKYMKSIAEEDGITTLVNLHQVEVAKSFATRIIGIKNGGIIFNGTPSELSNEVIHELYHAN